MRRIRKCTRFFTIGVMLFMALLLALGPSTSSILAEALDNTDGNVGITIRSPNDGSSPSSRGRPDGLTQILAWIPYADYYGEYANTTSAIARFYTDFSVTELNSTDPGALQTALAGKNVLLIPEQETGSLTGLQALGQSARMVLTNFVSAGGTIIVLDYNGGTPATYGILTGAGLMSMTPAGTGPVQPDDLVVLDPGHPVTLGVPMVFPSANGTIEMSYTDGMPLLEHISATGASLARQGYTVAAAKDIGEGHVVYFGFDLFEITDPYAMLVANAVRWSTAVAPPSMWLSTYDMYMRAAPGATDTQYLTISNGGDEPLTFSITDVELAADAPEFRAVWQQPDPVDIGMQGTLSARVFDPNGTADIRSVKAWVTTNPADQINLNFVSATGNEAVFAGTVWGTSLYGPQFEFQLEVADFAGHVAHTTFLFHVAGATMSASTDRGAFVDKVTLPNGEGTNGVAGGSPEGSVAAATAIDRVVPTGNLTGIRILYDEAHNSHNYLDTADPVNNGDAWSLGGWRNQLVALGARVDKLMTAVTPASLAGYDILVISAPRINFSLAELDAIQAFVNAGGGLLLVSEYAHYGPDSPGKLNEVSSRFGIGIDFSTYPTETTSNIQAHPITAGVSSVTSGYATSLSPAGSAYSVIRMRDNVEDFVVVNEVGTGGRVVAIGDTNVWTDNTNGMALADNAQLAVNIMQWLGQAAAAGAPWLDEEPVSGTVPSQGQMSIQINARGGALMPGDYRARIMIESNDPAQPVAAVNVYFKVVGTAELHVQPGVLDFTVQQGTTAPIQMLTIANFGSSADLNWFIQTPAVPWLGVTPVNGIVPAGTMAYVTVSASAVDLIPGQYHTELVVGSDAGANVTVPVNVTVIPQSAAWTFMVYLDADNNLDAFGRVDMNEMEVVGSTDQVNIIVLWDKLGDGNSRIYYVTRDTDRSLVTSPVVRDLYEVNMGSPNTLTDFIGWTMQNYPAQRYALDLWDHGSGWRSDPTVTDRGIAWDDTSAGDYLTTPELSDALAAATYYGSLNLIGFDACLMAMLEVDYAIQPYANVRVGAEDNEPGNGWPYDLVLADLAADPAMTAGRLGTSVVNRYMETYGYAGVETMSAVRLQPPPVPTGTPTTTLDIANAVNELAWAVIESGDWAAVSAARSVTEQYFYPENIDLWHFADRLRANSGNAAVQTAANNVKAAVTNSVIREQHGAARPNSRGIAIYFPADPAQYESRYDETLSFAWNTNWDEMLKGYYATKAPPILDNTVMEIFFQDSMSSDTFSFLPLGTDPMFSSRLALLYNGNRPLPFNDMIVVQPLMTIEDTPDRDVIYAELRTPDNKIQVGIAAVLKNEDSFFDIHFEIRNISGEPVFGLALAAAADIDVFGAGSDIAGFIPEVNAVVITDQTTPTLALGFRGERPPLAWELATPSTLWDDFANDRWNNASQFGPGDAAVAMKWGIGDVPAGENRPADIRWSFGQGTDQDSTIDAFMDNLVGAQRLAVYGVSGVGVDEASFGVLPMASDGFDPAYDIPEPPAPPSSVSYTLAYFHYPANAPWVQNLSTSFISPRPDPSWPLRIAYNNADPEAPPVIADLPSQIGPLDFLVAWDINVFRALPPGVRFSLFDAAGNELVHNLANPIEADSWASTHVLTNPAAGSMAAYWQVNSNNPATYEYVIRAAASDAEPPQIRNLMPAPGTIVPNAMPIIGADYSDNGTINLAAVELWVDGRNVVVDEPASVFVTPTGIRYTPAYPMFAGWHNVTVVVVDDEGNTSQRDWGFTTRGSFILHLEAGWNAISLPLYSDRSQPDNLFGTLPYYMLYRWSNWDNRYELVAGSPEWVMDQDIWPGEGYWILVLQPANIELTGDPIFDLNLWVEPDAAFIGAPYQPTNIADLVVTPDGAIEPTVYGWNAQLQQYVVVGITQPGQAYWVLVNQAGNISTPSMGPPPPG